MSGRPFNRPFLQVNRRFDRFARDFPVQNQFSPAFFYLFHFKYIRL